MWSVNNSELESVKISNSISFMMKKLHILLLRSYIWHLYEDKIKSSSLFFIKTLFFRFIRARKQFIYNCEFIEKVKALYCLIRAITIKTSWELRKNHYGYKRPRLYHYHSVISLPQPCSNLERFRTVRNRPFMEVAN